MTAPMINNNRIIWKWIVLLKKLQFLLNDTDRPTLIVYDINNKKMAAQKKSHSVSLYFSQ